MNLYILYMHICKCTCFLFVLDMHLCIYICVYTFIYLLKYSYIYILFICCLYMLVARYNSSLNQRKFWKNFPIETTFFGSCAFLRTKALSLGSLIIGRRGLVFLPGQMCDGCDAYNAMRDIRKSGIWKDFIKVIEVWDMSQVTLFIWKVAIIDVDLFPAILKDGGNHSQIEFPAYGLVRSFRSTEWSASSSIQEVNW